MPSAEVIILRDSQRSQLFAARLPLELLLLLLLALLFTCEQLLLAMLFTFEQLPLAHRDWIHWAATLRALAPSSIALLSLRLSPV